MIRLIPVGPQDFIDLQSARDWRGLAIPQGGLESPEVLSILVPWAERLQKAQGWGTWFGVSGGEVVVSIAVKDPVLAGQVQIGYGTAPLRRGLGHASAAVAALLPVLGGYGVRVVLAETSVDNPASIRVLQKAGFAQAGRRQDAEDGALICWRADLPG